MKAINNNIIGSTAAVLAAGLLGAAPAPVDDETTPESVVLTGVAERGDAIAAVSDRRGFLAPSVGGARK